MNNKPFKVANVREIYDLYEKEEISFSKMVGMLNDAAEKFYKEQNIERSCESCVFGEVLSTQWPCNTCGYEFGIYINWRLK